VTSRGDGHGVARELLLVVALATLVGASLGIVLGVSVWLVRHVAF
jgi:hypothetical protein